MRKYIHHNSRELNQEIAKRLGYRSVLDPFYDWMILSPENQEMLSGAYSEQRAWEQAELPLWVMDLDAARQLVKDDLEFNVVSDMSARDICEIWLERKDAQAGPIRLDVGCGNEKLEGWTGVDPYVETDIKAFMWELPFDDGDVDEIYSSHALEHVAKAQVVPTLKEWARVIKPGGLIAIHVPDLVWCCENWLQTRGDGWDMATLFGHQAHEGEFHKTGFTYELMCKYLTEAGLKLIKYEELQTHGQKTMRFECQAINGGS